MEEADDAAQAWWIGLGRKGVLLGTNFSAQTFVYLTKNTTNEKARRQRASVGTGPPSAEALQWGSGLVSVGERPCPKPSRTIVLRQASMSPVETMLRNLALGGNTSVGGNGGHHADRHRLGV